MNNNQEKIKNIVVTGPTATGKTHLAVKIASEFTGEIVSIDSRQVYKGMDIGTGKDLLEYRVNGQDIPYHLIDIVEPQEIYNLSEFRNDAALCLKDIIERGNMPVLSGGTPLYLDSIISNYKMNGAAPDMELRKLLKDLDIDQLLEKLKKVLPKAYEELKEGNNRNRIIRYLEKVECKQAGKDVFEIPNNMQWLILGVYFHRKKVHQRIEKRLDERLKTGMIEEVEILHKNGISWERLEFFGLEYKYVAFYLQGKLSLDEMRNELLIKIRQFAKRQDIWFRKMEREGKQIYWIREGDFDEASDLISRFLDNKFLKEPKIRLADIKY
jgi:tRNA dimethylallyltransferase